MNAFFNIKKIIRLIPSQDSSWLFWDFLHSLRFELKIPVTRLKYQDAQRLAVIARICIDGLGCYFTWVIRRDMSCGEILTSQLTPSLSVSPPVPPSSSSSSISPALLSSLICSSPADLPPSFKVALDLWEYSSLSSYGWTDPHTLPLHRGTGERVRYLQFLPEHSLSLSLSPGVRQAYKILHLSNKKHHAKW